MGQGQGAHGPRAHELGWARGGPQKTVFLQANGAVYRPCNGAWGAKGFTNLLLEDANIDDVREVLQIAAENVAK